ncbi:MAG: ice-binding family protein [Candidatus Cybelea sp.]
MRTSHFLASAFGACITVTLVAGCSGSNNAGGASAFAPPAQTSSTDRFSPRVSTSIGPLSKANPCPVVKGDVPLASAASFAVLGASTVTSTGLTILNGNLGVSPGTSITGFGPGVVNHGAIYAGGPVAAQGQADLAVGYNYTVALTNPTAIPADIGGTTIMPGLYNAPTTLGITGTVTLDGENNSNSVFIFQIPSTLTTAVRSRVKLIHEANACNVFWQVGSSATLNTASHFRGTIMAAVSISVSSTAQVRGRLLAESGAVTLIDDRVNSFRLENRH